MQINIFEAGRRILFVFHIIVMAGTAIGIILHPEDWKTNAMIGGGIILPVYLLAWAIGWILRGLLGIPTGEDRRPQPIPPPYC